MSTTSTVAAPRQSRGLRDENAETPPDTGAVQAGPPWLAPVHGRGRVDRAWLLIAGLMLAVGVMLFGWRGLAIVALAAGSALVGHTLVRGLLRLLRSARPSDPPLHVLVTGMLLGLALPVTPHWGIVALAGAALGVVMHGVGRTHRLRIHPVAVVMVGLLFLPAALWRTDPATAWQRTLEPLPHVLRPTHLVTGDVADAPDTVRRDVWLSFDERGPHDAIRRPNPQHVVAREQRRILDEPALLAPLIRRGELARMEAVLFGTTAGPIGATSAALLLALGLSLMYRRLAARRTALAALVGAVAVYPLLPMLDPHGKWTFVLPRLVAMGTAGGSGGPEAAVTWFGYVLLASALPLIVLVLAPSVAPLSERGRVVYGLMLGGGGVAATWCTGAPEAAYVALLVAGLVSRPLDALHRGVMG